MRFDFDAYQKVYPETEIKSAPIESAVDTFKPTEAEKAMDEKPGAEVMEAIPEEPTTVSEPQAPEGEQNE